MRNAFAVLVGVHGVAHLVGFAVPWRLVTSPEMPYKTTILAGRIDLGDGGIRVMAVVWLLAAVACVGAAVALVARASWGLPFTAVVLTLSAGLCLVEWPQARIGLLVNVGLLATIPFVGSVMWRQASSDMLGKLAAARSSGEPRVFRSECLDGLPPPVARYFRRVLRDGQPYVDTADFVQEAEFFVGGAWRPLHATQRFTTVPPGFLWDARIQMAPLLSVYVRDAYVDAAGSMRGDFLGLYRVVNQSGVHELDSGALYRYMAEAVWLPTALLPGSGIRWQGIDERSALATMTYGASTISLQFRFAESGDVAEIFASDRPMEVQGRYEPRPWLVRCLEYEPHEGMRIPTRCEVEWQLPEGARPYWRGKIVAARYSFDPLLSPGQPPARTPADRSDHLRRRTS